MRSSGISGLLLILLLIFCVIPIGFSTEEEHSMVKKNLEMMPVGKTEMRVMLNDTRRKLGSFQVCSLCTCCGGATKSYCLPSPCCYAINCNIPNRPFGFCSFTPKTCNCFGCHI